MKPTSAPQQSAAKTAAIIAANNVTDAICLVGIRGYYKDSMGKPGINDIGIYDDAMFVVGPDCHVAFNANTDPSVHKPSIATLLPGVYSYTKGMHGLNRKPYRALRQASDVQVYRDGHPGVIFTDNPKNRFWINIHKGSRNSTSSEGCQTIWPDQWESFIALAYRLMDEQKTKVIKYILVENT